MADDLTPREIARELDRLNQGVQKLGDRITESARESVPAQLWAAEREALRVQIADHIRQAGLDLGRLEQGLADERRTRGRDVSQLRQDMGAEIKALRTEVTEQPERWADKAWTRILASGALIVTLAGVVVAALSLGKG